jgi:hypothetical protein
VIFSVGIQHFRTAKKIQNYSALQSGVTLARHTRIFSFVTNNLVYSRRLGGQKHGMYHALAVAAVEPKIPHVLHPSGFRLESSQLTD